MQSNFLIETFTITKQLPEMAYINCIEPSGCDSLVYLAGELKSKNVRKSSPVIAFDIEAGQIKSMFRCPAEFLIC